MMKLRYYSEFFGAKNTQYRVEIWQEADGVETTAKEITLSSEPVELEWENTDKFEPVQGSSATLNLISMSDREFINLYTVEVDAIRLDVYRNSVLYWSGTLDPEIFEEPYSYKDRYVTTITFSDFGILDRKMWEGKGILSVRSVINRCLASAGFQYTDLVQYISTQIAEQTPNPMTLDEVFVIGENFYDEEDEPMTMREVLEETMRPFALRIVQKNGHVYLYDLNAIHAQQPKSVIWTSTDANIEADVIYNDVKVTFSPYANGALIDGSLKHEDTLKEQPIGVSGEVVRTNRDENAPEGFRIVCGEDSVKLNNLKIGNGAVLFRIDPEYSSSKTAGVLWGYRLENDWRHNSPYNPYNGPVFIPKTIITAHKCYIGTVPNPEEWKLRVTMDVLFDVRYNPFEGVDKGNEEGNWKRMQDWCNFGYIPIDLTLCDSDGKALYYYNNLEVVNSNGFGNGRRRWIKDTIHSDFYDHGGEAWLCYYNQNRKSASGFGGWATNKPTIGWYSGDLPSAFTVLSNGEYIEIPPVNGYLELRVYSGLSQTDNNANDPVRDIYPLSRWMAYKDIKVEVVKANGRDLDKEDIEDMAWINKNAKEGLEIDTIFGTMPDSVPSARGLLFNASGTVYTKFYRGGYTDRLERLLIGTVYSQHATRKHILSGTVELVPEFTVLTDVSEPGQYLLSNEVQHLMRDESEIRMVQFDKDNYEAIEYKS